MSRVLFGVTIAVLSLGLAACGGKDKPTEPASGPKVPDVKPDATYVVRGEVATLPVAGDSRTEFRVRHEAIDDFKDIDGKVVGMNAMTMEFPPAKGVDLSNLKKGDKVSITFSVWWKLTPPWMATKVEKLPDGTVLTFRQANPPAAPKSK